MHIGFESRVRINITSDKAFRKRYIFLSIFWLAINLLWQLSFDKIMNKNKNYIIDPDKYPTLVNTDDGTIGLLRSWQDGIELQCDFKQTTVLIQFVTTANETLGEQYLPYRWGGEEFRLVCLE